MGAALCLAVNNFTAGYVTLLCVSVWNAGVKEPESGDISNHEITAVSLWILCASAVMGGQGGGNNSTNVFTKRYKMYVHVNEASQRKHFLERVCLTCCAQNSQQIDWSQCESFKKWQDVRISSNQKRVIFIYLEDCLWQMHHFLCCGDFQL